MGDGEQAEREVARPELRAVMAVLRHAGASNGKVRRREARRDDVVADAVRRACQMGWLRASGRDYKLTEGGWEAWKVMEEILASGGIPEIVSPET